MSKPRNLKQKELKHILNELGSFELAGLLNSLVVNSVRRQDTLTDKMQESMVWTHPLHDDWESLTEEEIGVNLIAVVFAIRGQRIPVINAYRALDIARKRVSLDMQVLLEVGAVATCDPYSFVVYKPADAKPGLYRRTVSEGGKVKFDYRGEMEERHFVAFKALGVKEVHSDPSGA